MARAMVIADYIKRFAVNAMTPTVPGTGLCALAVPVPYPLTGQLDLGDTAAKPPFGFRPIVLKKSVAGLGWSRLLIARERLRLAQAGSGCAGNGISLAILRRF